MTGPLPSWFTARDDDRPDAEFYRVPRLVTHLDDAAIAAVGELYAELGVDGSAPRPLRVLDLMSSWVSHLRTPPAELVVLGLNAVELDANPAATERIVHDLNADPTIPLPDGDVDAVLCCVSVDYLTHPVEVLADVVRVVRPGGPVVLTFSNRCFPTKAVHGWLATDDESRADIVRDYLRRTGGFGPARVSRRTPSERFYRGDPLWAVVADALPDTDDG